jgi:signal transduction histidine kinase/CheY-like chemotaxis protein
MSGHLQQALDWIATPEGTPIEAWRRRILAAVLLGISVLGSFAYIVGALEAMRVDQLSVIVVDTVAYGGMIAITLGRRLPYSLRAGMLAGTPLVLGTFFLYFFGFEAAGFPWVLTFPILASVLLGTRAGATAFCILAVVLLALGLLIPSNIMPWTGSTPRAFAMWWVNTSSVLTLAGLVSISTGYLFDGLGREAEARQVAVREADRRERLASLGTLTGGIAHDFNNLLQPIVSDAEHARRLLPHGHEARPLLDDILGTAHRARTLVRRILSFARPVSDGEREVVDLGMLVHESERLLRAMLPPRVQLATTVAPDVQVVAEPAELQQILLNLVTNASHAMPRGGVVGIRVRIEPAGQALADTVLADVPRLAAITVSDVGEGMSDHTLSRAFEPFFTTKQPGHGTGLGLATVFTTVTALGGIVRAESAVGIGTRVHVWLPMAAAPVPAANTVPAESAPSGAPASTHVVVVDDEPAVLLATSRLIERMGYTVTRFPGPSLLLEQIGALANPPHIVLSDLSMPDHNGWELAATLHERYPALPVVIMTGNLDASREGDDPVTELRQRPGVVAVLAKPFTSAELRDTLQQSLR